MSVTRISAVLFDLGGTLLSYEQRELMRVPTLRALQRMGLDTDDASVLETRRLASAEVEAEYSSLSSFLHRDLFRDRVERAASALGVTATQDVLDQFEQENFRAIVDHLIPRPDAIETLAALRERGLYVGVVSNADDDFLDELMELRGIAAWVNDRTSSEEAQSCKPDQRIFEVALRKAARDASETLFVGDSLAHDVAGAHAAGMRTVLIEEPDSVAPMSIGLDASVPADFTVRTLAEIVAIVDLVNAEGE